MAKASVKSTMDLLDEFLGSFKKEAFEASGEQKSLGKEQTEAAKDSGSTAPDMPEQDEKDKDALETPNSMSPVRMGSEDSATEKSEVIDAPKKEVVTENIVEKTARATRLGNAILTAIDSVLTKEAAAKSPEAVLFQKIAAESAAAAQEYYESHLMGRLQRLNDEAELSKANLPKNVLQKVGGIAGLLDKIAMEDPEAILPAGAEMAVDGAPVGEAGDISEEELDALAAELEAQGVTPEDLEAALAGGGEGMGMPAEGMEVPAEGMEAPAEGGVADEEMIDQLASQLDEAGVTPEDLVSAFEDIQALQEAGVAPEELAAAVEEMIASEGAAPGGEEMAPEAEAIPAEAIPEELPVEEKEASAREIGNARARIDAIKNYLLA